jgi:hypothetical protein
VTSSVQSAPAKRFDAASVAHLDEPVRRYLTHALAGGAALHEDIELSMVGQIKFGRWLAFSATQRFSGHEYTWRAQAGIGRVKPLHVVDRYVDGRGSMDGRVFGRLSFLHAADEDTTRAAAGRGAAESVWVPASLLPERGVQWRTEEDDHIVVTVPAPPERPDLHLRIDDAGAVKSMWLQRWGNVGRSDFGYMPFGGDTSAERRFGDMVIPSDVTVGWGYGTADYVPFLKATLVSLRSGRRAP